MLISIYSDSTALPREDSVSVFETWPHLLFTELNLKFEQEISLLNHSFGGYTLNSLLKIFHTDIGYYYKSGESNHTKNILIFTSGIVDGALRPISYKLKILEKIPFVGKRLSIKIIDFLHQYRPQIQQKASYTAVSLKHFERDLLNLYQLCKDLDVTVLLLETPLPSSNLELRSPGLIHSIHNFNAAKRDFTNKFDLIKFIEINDVFRDDLYISKEDGHHFNLEGHKIVSQKLFYKIKEILQEHRL